MSGESCNSRYLSWLMKSCFPNPDDHQHHHLRRIPATNKPPENSPISSLPDDLLLECLSRVSLSSLPSLHLVCRRWSLLLLSPSFLLLRQLRVPFHPTLFSVFTSGQFATLRLGLDPQWNLNSFPLPTYSSSECRLTAIGPRIYIIGRTYMYRFDTWTQAVTARSETIYSRKKFAAAVVFGKIYVAGGAARTSALEEYDPHTDTWTVVSNVPRRRYGCVGISVEGIFYIIGTTPLLPLSLRQPP